jgi:hypothetical protein
MKNSVKFVLAGLTALALAGSLTNSSAQGRLVFDGRYAVSGVAPDGVAYSGQMLIEPYGDGYRITQEFAGVTHKGIGNDIGDYLAAAFLYDTVPGITLYRVTAANTLSGYWQDFDSDKEGTETAMLSSRNFAFVPSAPVANTWDYSGTYNVRGNNPDGSAYTATMILTSFGDGYRASFVQNGLAWRGIASYIGANLAIAWNDNNQPQVSIFAGNPRGGDLTGYWQDYNNPKEGQETATRR